MRSPQFVRSAVLFLLLAAGTAAASRLDDHAKTKSPAPKAEPGKPHSLAEPAPKKSDAPKPDAPRTEHPTEGDSHGDAHASSPEPADDHARAPAQKPRAADAVLPSADAALAMLREGNERWVAQRPTNPNTDSARRQEAAEGGQHPFVTVLTCADSRIPVERTFDRGVGEVFVVRVAGNIAGPSETGTIEYGLGHLKTPLLVVMGHTRCGAVAAAAGGKDLPGALGELVHAIDPAVARARQQNPGADEKQLAAVAVRENVWQSIFDLCRRSDETRALVRDGKVKVVGAICDINTGKVEWLGEHPWQAQLLDALDAHREAHAEGARE